MTIESWALLFQGLALIPAYGGMLLIWHGIRVMSKNAEMRAADSERKHEEVMSESARRHEEVMSESVRRHEEAMRNHDKSMAALRELIEGQAESRLALRELIERTGR